jgi:uncharacterized membrane protein
MDVGTLALALGASLTAGLNLYITVLTLGVMHRFEILALPPSLTPLAHDWVLIAAAVLFLIEFITDKIPYIDNLWDTFQTFIRIPAGAVLAAGAITDVSPEMTWLAAITGGFVTFSAHGAKATTRLALNSTPEPFTNWFMSFLEDGFSLAFLWLVVSHPEIALVIGLLLLAALMVVFYLFFRFFKYLFRRRQPDGMPLSR